MASSLLCVMCAHRLLRDPAKILANCVWTDKRRVCDVCRELGGTCDKTPEFAAQILPVQALATAFLAGNTSGWEYPKQRDAQLITFNHSVNDWNFAPGTPDAYKAFFREAQKLHKALSSADKYREELNAATGYQTKHRQPGISANLTSTATPINNGTLNSTPAVMATPVRTSKNQLLNNHLYSQVVGGTAANFRAITQALGGAEIKNAGPGFLMTPDGRIIRNTPISVNGPSVYDHSSSINAPANSHPSRPSVYPESVGTKQPISVSQSEWLPTPTVPSIDKNLLGQFSVNPTYPSTMSHPPVISQQVHVAQPSLGPHPQPKGAQVIFTVGELSNEVHEEGVKLLHKTGTDEETITEVLELANGFEVLIRYGDSREDFALPKPLASSDTLILKCNGLVFGVEGIKAALR